MKIAARESGYEVVWAKYVVVVNLFQLRKRGVLFGIERGIPAGNGGVRMILSHVGVRGGG